MTARNKFGIFTSSGYNPNFELMLDAGAHHYVVIEQQIPYNPIHRIRERYPNAFIVLRFHQPNPDDPVGWAQHCARKMTEHQHLVDAMFWRNESLENEWYWGNTRAAYERLAAWDRQFLAEYRKHRPHDTLIYPPNAPGNGDDWPGAHSDGSWIGYDILRPVMDEFGIDVVGVNMYWYATVDDVFGAGLFDSEWYGSRYKLVHRALPDKQLFITELGCMQTPGYENFGDAVEWKVWELSAVPYIVGAAWFIWSWEQTTNNWQLCRDLPGLVARLSNAGFPVVEPGDVPEPPPEPPPNGGDNVVDWDERLNATVFADGMSNGVKCAIILADEVARLTGAPQPKAGDVYWRVRSGVFYNPLESGNRTVVMAKAYHADGTPADDRESVWGWPAQELLNGRIEEQRFYSFGLRWPVEWAMGPNWPSPTGPDDFGPYFTAVKAPYSEVVYGMGLPANQHVAFSFTFEEATWGDVPEPPVPPTPPEESDFLARLREEAWNRAGVNWNPDAAFPRHARAMGLGIPETGEFDFEFDGTMYRAQGFGGGIVYCVIGEWDKVKHTAW